MREIQFHKSGTFGDLTICWRKIELQFQISDAFGNLINEGQHKLECKVSGLEVQLLQLVQKRTSIEL